MSLLRRKPTWRMVVSLDDSSMPVVEVWHGREMMSRSQCRWPQVDDCMRHGLVILLDEQEKEDDHGLSGVQDDDEAD